MARRVTAGVEIAAVLAVVAFLIAPQAAKATTIDFESPPVAGGEPVTTQFPGVTFQKGSPEVKEYPEMAVTGEARSPSHALNVSTQQVEFPQPGLEASFASTRSQLSLWVRNVTAPTGVTAHLKLQAYSAADSTHPVAESGGGAFTAVSSAGSWQQLTVSVVEPIIASFRLVSTSSEGHTILVDDLSFDDPVGLTPDFSLSTPVPRLLLPLGTSRSAAVSIARLNGSAGGISFSADGLPAGVSAGFAPNPVGGTGSATTLTLSASASAHLADTSLPVTITGDPAGAAVGPETRTAHLSIRMVRPFYLGQYPTTPLPLYPCETSSRLINAYWETDVTDTIAFDVTQLDGSELPAGLSASFDPSSVDRPTGSVGLVGSNSTLRLRRGDAAFPGDSLTLSVQARAGSLPDSTLPLEVQPLPPEITEIEHADAASAPQGLRPGSHIRVFGHGLCPGSTIEFGNERAAAALTGIRPAAGRTAGEMEGVVTVPRLATDGNATLITPGGLRSPASPASNVEVLAYRDTNGFKFKNDDYRDIHLAGYQELFGPRQTNFTIDPCPWPFECPIVTPAPDPAFLGWMDLADHVLQDTGGTCVGYSVGSLRLTSSQRRDRLGLPAVDSVWRLNSTDLVRGRDDIPGAHRRRWWLSRWLDIQHANQISAEFLHTYLNRGKSVARYVGEHGSSQATRKLRSDLEGQLRAGHRPVMLMRKGLGKGHAVVAYDVEGREGGGFFIRVYDNNLPYTAAETAPDGSAHQTNDEVNSRIELKRDGTWSYPKPSRSGALRNWSGNLASLLWIAVERELPLQPTVPWTLEGITTVFGAAGPADARGSAVESPPDVVPFVPLDATRRSPVYLADSGRAHVFAVKADRRGRQEVGFLGDGRLVRIAARGAPRASGEVTTLSRSSGLRFERRAPASVNVDVFARHRGAVRQARISTGRSSGIEELRLAGKSGRLSYRHLGSATTLKLQLGSSGRARAGRFASSPLRIEPGDRLTVRPHWNRLGARHLAIAIHRHGKTLTRVLRNRVRPAAVVRSVKVRAHRRGRIVVLAVRARLAGRLRGTTVAVSAVVLGGRRIRAKDQRFLRRARGFIRVRLRLRLGRRDAKMRGLRAAVGVVALSGKRAPTVSSRSSAVRLQAEHARRGE